MDRKALTMDGELVTIGDDVVLSSSAFVVGHDMLAGHITLRRPVSVASGCRIGEQARLGAGAEVTRDVPPATSTVPGERL